MESVSSPYGKLSMLGRGTFGPVKCLKPTKDKPGFVSKTIPLGIITSVDDLRQTIEHCQSLKSQHLIKYISCDTDENQMTIRIDYCQKDLFTTYLTSLKQQKQQFSEDDVWTVGTRLSQALGVLHSAQIIHGDVKPSNFFRASPTLFLTCDYGILPFIQADQISNSFSQYTSPETMEIGEYDFSSDVYSLGVILLEMCLGHPYKRDPNDFDNQKVEIPSRFSKTLRTLILSMIHHDQNTRPTIETILQTPQIVKRRQTLSTTPNRSPGLNRTVSTVMGTNKQSPEQGLSRTSSFNQINKNSPDKKPLVRKKKPEGQPPLHPITLTEDTANGETGSFASESAYTDEKQSQNTTYSSSAYSQASSRTGPTHNGSLLQQYVPPSPTAPSIGGLASLQKEKEMNERAEQLIEQEREIQRRETTLRKKENDLEERNTHIQVLSQSLTERLETITRREQRSLEQEQQLLEREQKSRQTEASIKTQETQIEQKQAELDAWEESVVSREKDCEEQLRLVQESATKLLEEHEKFTTTNEQKYKDRDNEIWEREAVLTEREADIDERARAIDDLEKTMSEREQTVHMKEEQIRRAHIQEKQDNENEERLKAMLLVVHEKEAECRKKEMENETVKRELDELKEELEKKKKKLEEREKKDEERRKEDQKKDEERKKEDAKRKEEMKKEDERREEERRAEQKLRESQKREEERRKDEEKQNEVKRQAEKREEEEKRERLEAEVSLLKEELARVKDEAKAEKQRREALELILDEKREEEARRRQLQNDNDRTPQINENDTNSPPTSPSTTLTPPSLAPLPASHDVQQIEPQSPVSTARLSRHTREDRSERTTEHEVPVKSINENVTPQRLTPSDGVAYEKQLQNKWDEERKEREERLNDLRNSFDEGRKKQKRQEKVQIVFDPRDERKMTRLLKKEQRREEKEREYRRREADDHSRHSPYDRRSPHPDDRQRRGESSPDKQNTSGKLDLREKEWNEGMFDKVVLTEEAPRRRRQRSPSGERSGRRSLRNRRDEQDSSSEALWDERTEALFQAAVERERRRKEKEEYYRREEQMERQRAELERQREEEERRYREQKERKRRKQRKQRSNDTAFSLSSFEESDESEGRGRHKSKTIKVAIQEGVEKVRKSRKRSRHDSKEKRRKRDESESEEEKQENASKLKKKKKRSHSNDSPDDERVERRDKQQSKHKTDKTEKAKEKDKRKGRVAISPDEKDRDNKDPNRKKDKTKRGNDKLKSQPSSVPSDDDPDTLSSSLSSDLSCPSPPLNLFGEIVRVFVKTGAHKSGKQGFGFVYFRDESSISKCLELGSQVNLNGNYIRISRAVRNKTLSISGFPVSAKTPQVLALFKAFDWPCRVENGEGGTFLVELSTRAKAEEAMQRIKNGTFLLSPTGSIDGDDSRTISTHPSVDLSQLSINGTMSLSATWADSETLRNCIHLNFNPFLATTNKEKFNEDRVRRTFEQYGKVTRTELPRQSDGGYNHYGYVVFTNDQDGVKAARAALDKTKDLVIGGVPVIASLHERARQKNSAANQAPAPKVQQTAVSFPRDSSQTSIDQPLLSLQSTPKPEPRELPIATYSKMIFNAPQVNGVPLPHTLITAQQAQPQPPKPKQAPLPPTPQSPITITKLIRQGYKPTDEDLDTIFNALHHTQRAEWSRRIGLSLRAPLRLERDDWREKTLDQETDWTVRAGVVGRSSSFTPTRHDGRTAVSSSMSPFLSTLSPKQNISPTVPDLILPPDPSSFFSDSGFDQRSPSDQPSPFDFHSPSATSPHSLQQPFSHSSFHSSSFHSGASDGATSSQTTTPYHLMSQRPVSLTLVPFSQQKFNSAQPRTYSSPFPTSDDSIGEYDLGIDLSMSHDSFGTTQMSTTPTPTTSPHMHTASRHSSFIPSSPSMSSSMASVNTASAISGEAFPDDLNVFDKKEDFALSTSLHRDKEPKRDHFLFGHRIPGTEGLATETGGSRARREERYTLWDEASFLLTGQTRL
ncbi:hypothetical protein BLNAU_20982 [Blattamonas nauphoetae]|uniref:non-specific serine/threonine protein kinase n=1 Tax=Blattamonas nauphoetae TaxID=2049346 RepID=A0ABQ9WXQ5_9EUKA|nr:hypothetical protein BLNAU_20982 [Blattamonas nauphoetae]